MLQEIIALALDNMMDRGLPLEEAAERAVDAYNTEAATPNGLLADTIRALRMVVVS